MPMTMVVTPDKSTLILSEAYANKLTAFDIAAGGSLSSRRVWADLDGGGPSRHLSGRGRLRLRRGFCVGGKPRHSGVFVRERRGLT